MSSTLYRRRKGGSGEGAWHFCSNCREWPNDSYESSEAPAEAICAKCMDLKRRQMCADAASNERF